MADDLLAKAKQWVVKQGFALELRTASAFRQAGFAVKQSSYYLDRQEQKYREGDVVASHPANSDRRSVHFTIECKSSDKPWVILTSSDLLTDVNRFRINGVLSHELAALADKMPPRLEFSLKGVSVPDAFGYALRKALVDNKDEGYSAAISTCKASQYLVFGHQGDRRTLPPLAVSFPVIVVDSPIFTCYLTESGDIELASVMQTEFLFEHREVYDTTTRIRVVHIDQLPSFARDCADLANGYLQLMTTLAK